MKPTIQLHRIVKMTLTPVTHYPATPNATHPEFWARDIIVTDASGDTYSIPLFSETPDGLTINES